MAARLPSLSAPADTGVTEAVLCRLASTAYILLIKWIAYLRTRGVYDST